MLQSNPSKIEYIVYAYEGDESNKVDQNRWQKLMSGSDISEIMVRAEQLFHSQEYKKIEIKKTYFDKKKGLHRAATFRILEESTQSNVYLLSIFLMLTFITAGLFYLQFA